MVPITRCNKRMKVYSLNSLYPFNILCMRPIYVTVYRESASTSDVGCETDTAA